MPPLVSLFVEQGHPILTNRCVLELYLTAETNAGSSFCVAGQDGTLLRNWCDILHGWLGYFGFQMRTVKAVNAKVKSLHKEYVRYVKSYNRRCNPDAAAKLEYFLEDSFEWCSDFRSMDTVNTAVCSSPSTLIHCSPVCAVPTCTVVNEGLRSGYVKLNPLDTDLLLKTQKLERTLARERSLKQHLLDENKDLSSLVGVRQRALSNKNVELVAEKQKLSQNVADLKCKQKTLISRTVHERQLKSVKQENAEIKRQLVQMSIEYETVESALAYKEAHISRLSKSKDRLRKKAGRRDSVVKKLKDDLAAAHESFAIDKRATEVYYEGIHEQLETKVQNGHQTKVELESQIDAMKQLETRSGGIYKPHVRLVYYDLLTKGVPANIVQHVVKSVLGKMTDLDIADLKLPSRSTAQRMVSEAGELAKVRTAYELVRHRNGVLGHHSDGTTKSLIHWGTHILKLDAGDEGSKTFTLTVSPVPSGKACDTVTQLMNVLSDTQKMAESLGLDVHDNDFSVARILSRMSDRAPNEKAVTRLLEVEKKKAGTTQHTIYQWTCASHKIDNVANAMTNACTQHLSGEKPGRKMTGAKKLIYEANKLVCSQSRKEYSKGADFKMFALDKDMYEQSGVGRMQPIVGNRYNIFLMNSIPTILAQDLVLVYLEYLKDTKTIVGLNLLEKSVHDGYLSRTIYCELLGYAIMYHFILQPLLAKGKGAKSPLEMNWYYKTAVRKMSVLCEDPSPLISDIPENAYLWPGAVPAKDSFQQAMPHIVTEASNNQDDVLPILCVMLEAGLKKLQDHAAEHLLDSIPSENELHAANVLGSATNDIVESCFGVLDREQTFSPTRNPVNTSALITAKKDKPVDYVLNQSPELMNKMVVCARKSATKKRKKCGTKVNQQLMIWQSSSAEREALATKRQQNRNKKRRTFDETVEGIREGNLIRISDNIPRLKGRELDLQFKMWNTLLAFGFSLQSHDQLKGYSGLTIRQKKENLVKVIKSNHGVVIDCHSLPSKEVAAIYSENDEHDESVDSSSDEELHALESVVTGDFKFSDVGSWVIVAFVGRVWYPGKVVEIHSEHFATINYLHPLSLEVPLPTGTGKIFKTPRKKDIYRTDSTSVFLSDFQVESMSSDGQYKLSIDIRFIHKRYLDFAEKYDIPLE